MSSQDDSIFEVDIETIVGEKLRKNKKQNIEVICNDDSCDKYDYLIAVACGIIGGLIDVFLVGSPGESAIGDWTDKQVDAVVKTFAKKMGWNPKEKNKNNVNSAIGYLEDKYRVNYDQRKPSDVNEIFTIAPNTHHMMSLAHSPDIIGLFFSILGQFTSTAAFVVDGQIVTINTETFELQGGNFIAKLLCGIANWFGHIMSDIAGSSGNHGRGTGIVMPFYELFGFIKVGSFTTTDGKKDFAELAQTVFTKGYDLRFALAQAIPLAVTELSIRLIWAIRRRCQYKLPIKSCIPSRKYGNLRLMLIIGDGTLCAIDGIQAGVKSGGNVVAFVMNLNLVAWFHLTKLVIREICLKYGLKASIDQTLESINRINIAIEEYLAELKRIDIKKYKEEVELYKELSKEIVNANSEQELNNCMINMYERVGIELPWNGDFDDFMSKKSNRLVFS